jgi:formylglycine-generating enzyme required for sulfatase activity
LLHGLARSAEYSKCQTPEGVFDMMGNLHEWVWDQAGTFRGGYYVDTSRNGEGCEYRTTAHDFEYWDYSTGFRCCAEPVAPRDLQQRNPR